MHVVTPHAGQKAQKVSGLKEHMSTSLRVTLSRKISQMKVVEYFESSPHKAVLFFWSKEKRRHRNGMSRSCRRSFLTTKSQGEKRRKRKRQVRYGIVQKVVEDIEKKARTQVDVKPTAQRTFGQSVNQSCDCSHIENEEEDEEKILATGEPDGSAMGRRREVGGGLGTKKDGRNSLQGDACLKGRK